MGKSVAVDNKETTPVATEGSFFSTRRYRLTGIAPMLGSQPASEAIRTQFIATKAPSEELSEEERELFAQDMRQNAGLSVFARDPDNDDRIILLDYMIRGFFKSAIGALSSHIGISAAKSKVDKFLFVAPRRIPVIRDGEAIYDEDSCFERPLRAETMRGPRVGLASSECIDTPWSVEFEVRLVTNPASAKSKPLGWDVVETALDYGRLSGLGQFRNGGYGAFTWERVE